MAELTTSVRTAATWGPYTNVAVSGLGWQTQTAGNVTWYDNSTTATITYQTAQWPSAVAPGGIWTMCTTSSATAPVWPRPAAVPTRRQRLDGLHRVRQRDIAGRRATHARQRATRRAEALLLAHLNAEQQEEYLTQQVFHVAVGTHLYRLEAHCTVKRVHPVTRQRQQSYCIIARENVPAADTLLAQKLLIETNEAEFLRIAHASG